MDRKRHVADALADAACLDLGWPFALLAGWSKSSQLWHLSPFHLSSACGSLWPSLTPSTEHAAGPVTQRFQPLRGLLKGEVQCPILLQALETLRASFTLGHGVWHKLGAVVREHDPCSHWDPLTGAGMVMQLCHPGRAL